MTNTPRTQNPAWGFYGTMVQIGADADAAWDLAMGAITAASPCSPDEVRAFLDSHHGRHFADDVASTSVDAAVAKWMAWTTTPRSQRRDGIPAGLRYLTACITAAALEAEIAG